MRQIAIDSLGIAGAGALLYGVACVYAPAAWILGGALAIGYAFLASGKGEP